MPKRCFDIVLGGVALLLLLPFALVVAVAVLFSMGRPVLFRQVRSGLNARDFSLFKFRSMREANGPDGKPLPDEERVTAVGRFVRRSRLDELPELLLVISGAMSFVGPRPLPRHLLEEHCVLAARSRVRPGLTGLAQVSGNTRLTNEEKFAIDCYYVDHRTLLGDAAILVATLRTVVGGERRDELLIQKALRYANSPDRRSR